MLSTHDRPKRLHPSYGDCWRCKLVLIYLKMAGASSSVGGSLPRTRPAGNPGWPRLVKPLPPADLGRPPTHFTLGLLSFSRSAAPNDSCSRADALAPDGGRGAGPRPLACKLGAVLGRADRSRRPGALLPGTFPPLPAAASSRGDIRTAFKTARADCAADGGGVFLTAVAGIRPVERWRGRRGVHLILVGSQQGWTRYTARTSMACLSLLHISRCRRRG